MTGDQQVNRFSLVTQRLLNQSGWFPGRDVLDQVRLAKGFDLSSTAAAVLKEFGNLSIGEHRRGIECAQSTIIFKPHLADYENDRFSEWSEVIQSKLYPLGETDDGLFFLAIDQQERVYLVMNRLLFVDASFDKALEKILTGIKKTPIGED